MGQRITLPADIVKVKTGSRAYIIYPDGKVTSYNANGTLVITESHVYYFTRPYFRAARQLVGIPYESIEECKFIDHFSVPGRCIYYRPCFCSCVPNGLVNIIANINEQRTRVAIAVVNADKFTEIILERKRLLVKQDASDEPMKLPENISSERVESTVGDRAFTVYSDGRIFACQEKGTLFLTDKCVYYYASPIFKPTYRYIGIPYEAIRECEFIDDFSVPGRRSIYHKPTSIGNCTNGLVNIVAIINGQKTRVAFAVVLAEEFTEKIIKLMYNTVLTK